MQTQYQNKQIVPGENKGQGELDDYHFPGGMEYEPITLQAHSQSEANQLWQQKRKKVGENQTTNQEKGN